ncbi:RNA-guided pseudouridylation complex pseudouridine synthase subunit Cbf5 [Halorubrum lacusprofundi]|jgi:tRNA pseudouridine55 synthase|uniref:Probable tRNA pseudouridine synthase B n=1 Tax=Halorubrum lacusprofundi (strain ATCC 49239 / DSM 5036 / JCM 8891 / ACAM 34) TaxID=416348 RepID=B9LPV3_HALLT|nr:RNA-guided pseudouridylation complex pseudouridine synthase subunit Cbf5 [Halorubrum lacusprofundi]ACM57391.1 pseudouridylate synthase TruB domain protein [Halorubrum lacusprofundi ATCC 49239]MCG1006008.1 RNA-guided pseudouridylation complex pseudouridine synthase subunit Cbf5 [Halorubrum lacusprofundi]
MTRHSDDTDANTGADTGRDADADADGDAVDPLRSPPDQRSVPELLRFGVVNVDKPAGPSSHQLSAWVRDAINETLATLDPDGSPIHGVAHAGTLDPKVTGCLPTLTGDATRAAQVFLEGSKEYVSVLELHGSPPADFRDVVAEFEAEIYQKPPRKSAVTRRLRTRTIYDLDVLEVDDRQALLRIRCESGTYIRKLCHDIGLATGVGAHMGHLRRTATDPFDDRDLHPLQDLVDGLTWAEEGDDAFLREVVRPAEDALVHLPSVTIAPSAARNVATGAPVYAPGVIDVDSVSEGGEGDDGDDTDRDPPLVACHTPDGAAVCLGRLVGDPDAESGVVVSLERVLV